MSSANDIPLWLASLSDKTLQRLNSRLTHLLRMIDVERQNREPQRSAFMSADTPDGSSSSSIHSVSSKYPNSESADHLLTKLPSTP
ncbi:hypothetical protein HWE02_22985 [Pseudomonas oryzihabitans]|uniref:hypothetical protein n=1 Tax=Pseudomonas oryzihabitans TaxID=47885 RepID=UPI00128F493B|nr:hypothetical protein [Pseudomonas oryzihabitans]MCI1012123.1 hypothetical protein [Pseudomonas oryzihabitans]